MSNTVASVRVCAHLSQEMKKHFVKALSGHCQRLSRGRLGL